MFSILNFFIYEILISSLSRTTVEMNGSTVCVVHCAWHMYSNIQSALPAHRVDKVLCKKMARISS